MKQRENGSATDREKKIKRVEKSVLGVLLALVIAAVAFVAGWFGRWGALGEKKQNLLWAIDTAEDNYYLEIGDSLYDKLYSAFKLDPYSRFYTEEEYSNVQSERDGVNADAGFSIYRSQHPLRFFGVSEASVTVTKLKADENAGTESGSVNDENSESATSGMFFFKYGRTADVEKMESGDAEDFYDFAATLKDGETYYALMGISESVAEASVYAVAGASAKTGGGLLLTRVYDPVQIYQVVGNSPADKAKIVSSNADGAVDGLKRGMYILKMGKEKEKLESASPEGLSKLVASCAYVKESETFEPFYLQCSFDSEDENAAVYEIVMKKEYAASYCFYRDVDESYRFRADGYGKDKKLNKPKAVKTGEPLSALDKDTAYIQFTEFTGTAAEEFKECLRIMKTNHRKYLILDLRGNGGGYMDVFVEIASCLLKETGTGSQRVAYAKFKNGATVSYSAKKSNYSEYFEEDSRVSILADEHTASASECLIGALVDYKTTAFSDIYLRQDENGDAKTYGKGIMQTHYENSNGSTLKLTSAKIFWPKSDRTIHGTGVNPTDCAGVNAISSPLLPDADDAFLQTAIEKIQNKHDAPSASV